MIEIKISGTEKGYSIVSTGHGSVTPEKDRACTSVVVLLYALGGILANYQGKGKDTFRVGTDKITVRYEAEGKRDFYSAGLMFDTVIIGLMQVEQQYPEYVKLIKPAAS